MNERAHTPVRSRGDGRQEPREAQLAAGFAAGDERCAEAVHRRWRPVVHSLARRALGDEREAEDVVQQVFLAAWRGRCGFRPGPGGFGAWLTGITRHKVADALEARTRRARATTAAARALPGLNGRPAAGGRPEPEAVVDRVLGPVFRTRPGLRRLARTLAAFSSVHDVPQLPLGGAPTASPPSSVLRAHAPDTAG